MAKRKTEYMELIERNKQEELTRKLEIEREELEKKQKEELKKQLISENKKKIEGIGGQCKLRGEEAVKGCGSVVLKPAKKGNPSGRIAVNGVHCLGKKIENN